MRPRHDDDLAESGLSQARHGGRREGLAGGVDPQSGLRLPHAPGLPCREHDGTYHGTILP